MRFHVEAGPRRLTIDVERLGDEWAVSVDGRPCRANLSTAGGRWSLLLTDTDARGALAAAPRSYEVGVEPWGSGRRLVHIRGRVVPVAVGTRRPRPDAHRGDEPGGSAPVSAPMAGRVVKVLVAPGDRVVNGQGLVVVESMKMENELRARRDGTVTEVRVREGEPVEARAPLVVIGP